MKAATYLERYFPKVPKADQYALNMFELGKGIFAFCEVDKGMRPWKHSSGR
jgi:hypothetical protein